MGFSFCEEVLMSPFKSTDSISMSMSVIKRRADRVKTNTPACTATNQHGSFSNSWIGGKRQMAGQLWSLTHIFIYLSHFSFTASHKRDCATILKITVTWIQVPYYYAVGPICDLLHPRFPPPFHRVRLPQDLQLCHPFPRGHVLPPLCKLLQENIHQEVKDGKCQEDWH